MKIHDGAILVNKRTGKEWRVMNIFKLGKNISEIHIRSRGDFGHDATRVLHKKDLKFYNIEGWDIRKYP